jgi:hypothetical protein
MARKEGQDRGAQHQSGIAVCKNVAIVGPARVFSTDFALQ